MKFAFVLIILIQGFGASAQDYELERKFVSIEHVKQSKIDVDMGSTHVEEILYREAVIRMDKKPGTFASARVVAENLAYCEIVKVDQQLEGVVADLIVDFDVENDGGFNSCTIEFTNGERTVELELGAEVGE